MLQPALSQKEAIWLACKAKRCCSLSIVVPTGRDVWRIARTLDVPPAAFLRCLPATQPRRDAFMLDGSGQTYRAVLDKRRSRRSTSMPCVFLLRTRSGHHRCGLGDLRPLVCRAFPAELDEGVLCLTNDGRCSCRTWSLADVDIAEEVKLVETRQRDAEEYCAIVGRWNARVKAGPTGVSYGFDEYCAYLLEAYDALPAGAA